MSIFFMANGTFDILILIGRPASGKSEIIDFLTRLSPGVRRQKYHLAQLDILDDFPMLWVWFEEDDILSQELGLPRLHTDDRGYFKFKGLWHLLIQRLCLDYSKRVRDEAAYHDGFTTLIEFSRGTEHGGYTEAFQHLSGAVLGRAAILYVCVPFEESLRKNRRRFNPDKPDSILEHGLSDEKLTRLYSNDDFSSLVEGDSGLIEIRGQQVPYAVFPNEDDITTGNPEELAGRLEAVLGELWDIHLKNQRMNAVSIPVENDHAGAEIMEFSDLDGEGASGA